MIFLKKEELIAINKRALTRSHSNLIGVQYPQGLDIVIEQPQQGVFGRELYPNIWIKAAFIIQKITKKHPFMDGNKRTAILAGLIFLDINGYELEFTADEGEKIILGVTNSADSEETMVSLAEWLKIKAVKKA
ncbi:type II toxin-antitoxin system death-on-curing family toxin [Companilactobacillus allii]|uniref:Death-on-curing family protein n=1 Tax=Companilactobacillus allii TaxID=1847728 RepID=A0A1P8Q2Q9_9LACO|nr:type II toxin-antitoxin system death-on-curing family toxin [Companilactobacillus allii]APX72150.1 death-on-curing family protein [Companilactobacillus allii]USQ69247.1 type II toxin-antitoxin system death-on-curing family toxin [Companilactobacillus allii]